jgi:AsmA-like C-terminal region/Protein of unknown function
MRRGAGQAARIVWRATHGTAAVALTVALLAGTGVGVLAWRLGRGPIALPWLTARIEAEADRALAPDRLRLGQVALAWEGFRSGLGAPLDLRLSRVRVLDRLGRPRMAVPEAAVSLSLPALLRLRLVPRSIEIERPRLVLQRAADGTIGLDVGMPAPPADGPAPVEAGAPPPLDPAAILVELARPPAAARSPDRFTLLSQLRRLLVRNASLVVIDRGLGAVWSAPLADLDLVRGAGGGVSGQARLGLDVGGTTARLTLGVDLPPGGAAARMELGLAQVSPAALAAGVPALAPLAAIDAPVGGTMGFNLGPAMRPRQISLQLEAGPGQLHVAGGTVPILGARLDARGTPERIALHALDLSVPGAPGQPPSALRLNGTLARADGTMRAALILRLDQVAFNRLPVLWPEGIAPDTRRWILQNIPEGEARDGEFTFGLSAPADLSHVQLFEAAGSLRGTGLVVHWLRPVPPLVDGTAELRLRDPDRLDIDVISARQAPAAGQPGGLALASGVVRITGLDHPDQDAAIEGRITGPLPAALALLQAPKLGLLARHPLPLHDPAGQVSVRINLELPLLAELRIEQVQVGATAALSGVHLGRLVAGRDLDDGRFDLVAGTDGLTLSGDGRLGGIPAHVDGRMDFRAGPPDQVQQHFTAMASTDTAALALAGIPTDGWISGPVSLGAEVIERRNGTGTVAVRADLTEARISVAPLRWDKPPGQPARLGVTLPLRQDRLDGTAPIALSGGATAGAPLDAAVRAGFEDGRLAVLHVTRLRFGGNDLDGDIRFPGGGRPITVQLSGRTLDLAARLAPRPPPPYPQAPPPPTRGPPWTLAAQIATVRLAGGETLSGLSVNGTNDGLAWRQLQLHARIGTAGQVEAHIAPAATGRSLLVRASDAGALAHGLGLPGRLEGGQLTIEGQYGPEPASVLNGTGTLEAVRLRDAPILARLLQAVTLYGVVDMLRGHGLQISHLIAPFQLDDGMLTLREARAFSPSVGVTAAGRIDLDRQQLDLTGTIVPAYFFNSLLGHVPLVGRLFSPEQGGGLFAANYAIKGPLAKPAVSVNPLSALTPGFLRGVFKLF